MEPTANAQGSQLLFREGLGDDLVMKLRAFCQRHWENFAQQPSHAVVLAGTTVVAALIAIPRSAVLPWVFDRRTGVLQVEGLECRAVICEDPALGDLDYRMLVPARNGVLGRPSASSGTLAE